MPTTTVDSTLNDARVDITTGTMGQPFDMYVNVLGTTNGYIDAATALVDAVVGVYTTTKDTREPRIQCTFTAVDRNAVSMIITQRGFERWRETVVSSGGNGRGLHELLSRDLNGAVQGFLREWKAEGVAARTATYDLYLPDGSVIHWAGHV